LKGISLQDAENRYNMTPQLKNKSIGLLKTLIATPSFSREEDKTAAIITGFLEENGVRVIRKYNNVWARSSYWSDGKPVILLNSHHDTVRPVKGWTRDPFEPAVEGDRLYGLGSNDAGGSLVSLIAAFLHFSNQKDLPFNLILAATAEEEISGENGVASILTGARPHRYGHRRRTYTDADGDRRKRTDGDRRGSKGQGRPCSA
jgi:acetylornithine deacetylase